MKLWLDDIRPVPEGFVWAKDYAEAIKYLMTGEVTYASLDHDLADAHYLEANFGWMPSEVKELTDEKTGYDVILWMEENDVWPKNGVDCHSMNPVGRTRIEAVIAKHYG